MLLKNKKIAILGAGPVGLTLATLLQQAGIDVNVYERDGDAKTRISGGTLDLHKGSGQEALKKAGLLERYYALAKPMGRTVVDDQGNVLFSKKPGHAEQYDNPEINRNDLRQLLLDSLASDTVVWDRKFTGLEEHNGRWLVHFENDIHAAADVVIGANGGMSRARKQVTDADIEYTGTLILQGEVVQPERNCAEFYQLCDNTILMASGEGYLLIANPENGSILSYNVIFKKPEEWAQGTESDLQNTDMIIAFLSHRFARWHACYHQLFRATSSFVVLPTRKMPLDKPWKTNRPLPITLVGDAAHSMPPFAGQGVNTGLLDAFVLSDNLTSGQYETIQAAIDDYERKMFGYATAAQRETSQNEIEMLLPTFSFQKLYQ
ncbi:NAD(P)/FAD-dependent oxidoreductase [Larkinella sp. C7]|jgi:2-polyprenyl-6-methoxyphenol hydroxylase-like FAD-dependent oxidoreductase|uniref:FAD-dependent oxidoreductase n=1 Tax=Larkinella sp. C7 TaxID=2576607 RepID=UPI001111290F|nr:NAD(P)/FAD-dependent oxidoreductase [Larkinella sp. C7]